MMTPLAQIHRLGGGRDLALAAFDVVFGPDADGAQMGLRPDHMLHRGNEFLGQAAMGDQNNADHDGFLEAARTVAKAPRPGKGLFG